MSDPQNSQELKHLSDRVGKLEKELADVKSAAFITKYGVPPTSWFHDWPTYRIPVASVVEKMAAHLGFGFERREAEPAKERALEVIAPAVPVQKAPAAAMKR